jgi:hypothetical protein
MRAELLTAITAAVSTLTQFAVSTELPWSQGNLPLYRKNMKKIYVDRDDREQTILYPVFVGQDVYDYLLTTRVYVAVDAKNPPSQLDSVITKIISAKDTTTLVTSATECDYSIDKDEDVLIYTFEFRFAETTT